MTIDLDPGSYVVIFRALRPLSETILRAGFAQQGIEVLACAIGEVSHVAIRTIRPIALSSTAHLRWIGARSIPIPIEGSPTIDLVTDRLYDLYVIARRRSHRTPGDVVAALADMNLIASQILALGPVPIAGAPDGATDAYAAIAARYLGPEGGPTIADPIYIAAGAEIAPDTLGGVAS